MKPHKYYDETAKGYDELHGDEQKQKLHIIKKELNIKKTAKILDVGGGTGLSTEILNANITILEPSREMLNQGLTKKRIFHPVNEKAENIENCFEENEFDTTICLTTAHHFKNLKKAIKGIKKVTKNNGDIVFTLLKKSDKTPKIKKELEKEFLIKKEIKEEKDTILFLKNNK